MSMVFDKMVCPFATKGIPIVREAAVSLSLLVDVILCSLLSDGLSPSLHLALCRFSSVSVLHICFVAMLTCQMFIRQEILTYIIDGIRW